MRKIVWLFIGFFPSLAWAATSASVQNFLPAVDGAPYFTVSGSRTLEPWRFDLDLTTNYSKKSLIVGQGAAQIIVVDDLLMTDFTAAVGLLRWLDVGIDVPFALWNDVVSGRTRENNRGLGDIRLEPKLRIVDIDEYDLGLSFVPFFVFPTGDGDHFIGNNSFSGGGRIVFDGRFLNRAQLSLNAGFLIREGFLFPTTNTERDEAYLLGLGLSVRMVDWMDLIAEVQGSILAKAPLDREAETPLEADAGFRFHLPWIQGLQATLGGGAGLTFGYGTPDFRGFLGVGYTRPLEKKPPPPPPIPEPMVVLTKEKIEIHKKVHFEYNKAILRPVSYPLLDAVAALLQDNSQVHKVQIQGHTDSKGTDAYNLRLSQQRAEAVRKYLIDHGIDPARLTAKGYGESQPIDTNDTDLGRARNRRVEFVILEQDEVAKPAGSPANPATPTVAP